MAEARVRATCGVYLRLAKKVTWPGAAMSRPAAPVISMSSTLPSICAPVFCASSDNFMRRSLTDTSSESITSDSQDQSQDLRSADQHYAPKHLQTPCQSLRAGA